ncbi:MAG: c-type cytochrome biogenesis protein CcmI [Methylococcales bacterium]
MNAVYWSCVIVLIIIAFVIIIPPLWKKRELTEAGADQRNIKIAKERVKELRSQLHTGELSQLQFDEQLSELELTLSDDLDIQKQNSQASSQGKWVVPVIVLFIPLFTILSYLSLGEPDALIKAEIKQSHQTEQDINAMVAQLALRLKENPSNAKDWIMLGRSFKYLKQYKLAANSFKKAYKLLGDDPEVLLHYADALAMLNNGSLVGKPAELVFKALEKSPNDVTGLWLAGMAKAEKRDFPAALKYWHKLQTILPKNSEPYTQVQNLISTVQAQISGAKPSDNTVTSTAETTSIVSIEVQVNLSKQFKQLASTGDTVFIYAKALTGPPMPLAIVRKQVSDLPITVTLDDKMAMMPTMKLSNFKAVKVMARVSKSGSAMPQKGDFVGSVDLSKLETNQTVVIVINQKI